MADIIEKKPVVEKTNTEILQETKDLQKVSTYNLGDMKGTKQADIEFIAELEIKVMQDQEVDKIKEEEYQTRMAEIDATCQASIVALNEEFEK